MIPLAVCVGTLSMVRTLVVSDLHLGSRMRRDVLRQPEPLSALLGALDGIDRLVLMGDVIELLEGRPRRAMAEAEPVLRELGAALGRGREVVIVPGNHDHLLVRPWLRERMDTGKRIGLTARVAARSSGRLEALASWLKPARVSVRYPGFTVAPGVFATHGHYLDRHLMPSLPVSVSRGPLTPLPDSARPEDYERASGPSAAAVQGLLATALPGAIGDPFDIVAGVARRLALAAVPVSALLRGGEVLAPLSAGLLGVQFRRAGLPAMARASRTLGVRAQHVIFGHLHRAGPLPADPPAEWTQAGLDGPLLLHNTGSWVYEPLLLAGMRPPHPYWPGGAVLVEEGRAPRTLTLLDDVPPELLLP